MLTLLLASLLTGSVLAADVQGPAKPAKKVKPQLVHAITVIPADTQITHERTGSLRYNRQVRIFNQEEGRITELPGYEGDKVSSGEVLVRLDDALIRAELNRAQAQVRQAQLDLRRLTDLVAKRAASRDELARARTAVEIAQAEASLQQTRLSYTVITAPFTSVITERRLEPGDVAPRHSHLLTLADPGSLLIETQVSDVLLPHLRRNDPVSVRIDALGQETYIGHVLRIHPQIDPATRLGIVEVLLDPVPAGARAGQFVRITLTSAAVPRLMIPFSALRRDNTGEYVFVISENKATRQTVQSGLRLDDRVEILSGLKTGQSVIYRGFLGLSDGKVVKAVSPGQKPQASAEIPTH